MRAMNELLATGPFDLYELQLFHLVAEHLNFTRAGRAAGLTQSAITRQIAGMESRLGVQLFERTTRSVHLTPAGAALYARSGAILSNVGDAIKSLRERFELGPSILRIGIARTIGLAYLPGFFKRFQRVRPDIQLRITHQSSAFILGAVESGELDGGFVTMPPVISPNLEIARRFADEFVAIAPPQFGALKSKILSLEDLNSIFAEQKWLLISEETNTGKQLRAWLDRERIRANISMETDNFDLLINLVSLGLGVSIVPHRALALHPTTRPVRRMVVKPKFARELLVITRRQKAAPNVIRDFTDSILF
jgi:DNA-binding transcriptional LysR family regulator